MTSPDNAREPAGGLAEELQRAQDPVDVLDTTQAGPRVIRGGVFRVGAYLAGVLLSVGSAAILIRHLGVVSWGRYVTVSSLVATVGGLSEAGMTSIGVREYSVLERRERDRLLQNLFGLRVAITAVGMLAALVFAVVVGYPSVLVAGTALGGVALLFGVAQQTASIPLVSSLRLGWVAALDFARQAATVAAILVLVALGASLLPFLAIPVPVSLFVLIATVAVVPRAVPLVPAIDLGEWRRILGITIAYAAASAVGTIYVSMTVILMSVVGTTVQTGYFGASYRIFSVLSMIPLLLVTSAFPVLARAARDDRQRLAYALQRLLEIGTIFGTWLSLMIVLGAPLAIHVVAGPGFGPAISVLRIQGLALIGTFIAVTLGFTLLSLERHRALLVANLFALAVSAALTVSLVPFLGARGGAVATVVGEFGLAFAYASVVFTGPERFRISLERLPPVVLASLLALALWLVPGLGVVPLMFAATAVYFATLAVFRAIPDELWEAAAQLRHGRTG
jgi:O-antigen/teichoic acid export membrane protein